MGPDQVEAAPSTQLTAVTVRGLKLSYSRTGPPIIDHANMTVPHGAIYGLLGASGCGKTTLLKCLVGLCKPNAGTVLIYGQELHKGLVPGPGVGFMPQELALHMGFTIAENMYFFGQLLGMPKDVIFQRINFLCSFFQLLPADRFVDRLSGGQQRRVSLAVALMHEPPFLILDEPTVGLDPVLRAAIWRYFLDLSKVQHTTLLVTTHFIEEIAEADVVGLMKNGKIWCEQTPAELMEAYESASLSDTYLKICQALEVSEEVKPVDEKPKEEEALDVIEKVKPVDEKPKVALDAPEKVKPVDEKPKGALNVPEKVKPVDEKPTGALNVPEKVKPVEEKPKGALNIPEKVKPVDEKPKEALDVPEKVKLVDKKPKEALDVPEKVKPVDEKPKEAFDGNRKEPSLHDHPQLLLGPLMEEAKLLPKPRLAPSPQVTFCPVPDRLLTWSNWGPMRCIFRTRALVIKNVLKIMRRLITVLFQLVVPSIAGVIFCLFVGGNPTNLPVAVVNQDPDGEYSHRFLDEISTKTVSKKPYDDLQSSFEAVLDESAWGTIFIPANYTDLIKTRLYNFTRSNLTITAASTINFFVDATDYIIRNTLRVEIVEAHLRYIKDLSHNFTGQNFSIETIRFSDPFYHAFDYSYREFMSPGIIITTLFVLSMSLTALLLVAEHQEGIRARSIVSGVTSLEVILGHAIVQMAMAYMQTVLMLVVFVSLFDTPVRGSYTAAFFLPVFMALCGMCFGFLTSAVSKDEATALLLSMACMYPSLLMGGVLWPLQGAPHVLRPLSMAMPQAFPAHALRGVMLRNYTLDNPFVLKAFASSTLWTTIYILIALMAFFK